MNLNGASKLLKVGAFALAAVLLAAGPVRSEELTDYEHALEALEAGRIIPLAEIFLKVEKLFEGEVLEVQLDDPNYKGGDEGGGAGGTGLEGDGDGDLGNEGGDAGDLGDEGGGSGGEGLGEQTEKEDTPEAKPQSTGITYVIKLLTPQGNVLKIEIDAKTAELLKVSGRGVDLARKKH